jgi:hypothetical protein
MKLFECQNCGQALYFENVRCESCGMSLGYLPSRETVTALEPEALAQTEPPPQTQAGAPRQPVVKADRWKALAEPRGSYRSCANTQHGVCNWLVPAESPEAFCLACRHNRTIPDLSQPDNLKNWQRIEIAKHRLFYSLLMLRLPLVTKAEDPDGLAFDFLASPSEGSHLSAPVMTGHDNGLITINLAEADDSERERQRRAMGEPYRTLLGHFRHEIAHYYWDRLVANTPAIDDFREVFGDERQPYGEALKRHYENGPPADWPEHFVSAYASTHPWEDFAETWAHYFHMVDTLETAAAFGLRVRPKVSLGADLAADINFDPHKATMEKIIDAWLPLAFASNSINRSMGLPDLYPFVLTPPVIVKLTYIHERIRASRGREPFEKGAGALRAVIAGLKRSIAAPQQT